MTLEIAHLCNDFICKLNSILLSHNILQFGIKNIAKPMDFHEG